MLTPLYLCLVSVIVGGAVGYYIGKLDGKNMQVAKFRAILYKLSGVDGLHPHDKWLIASAYRVAMDAVKE